MKRFKIFIFLIIILSVAASGFGFGRGFLGFGNRKGCVFNNNDKNYMETEKYEKTLKQKYNVDQLISSELSNPELEKLGEKLMRDMSGSDEHYDFMIKRMGGKNSEDLINAKKNMATRYLQGDNNYYQSKRGMMHGGRGLNRNRYSDNSNSAIEILKKRLAKGEISMEEYNLLKKELEK